MGTLIIKTKKNLIKQLQNGSLEISEYLEQHFDDAGEKFEWELRQEHLNDGGAPTFAGYELEEIDFNEENLEGTFSINYVINSDYGCDDMNHDTKHERGCCFEIDDIDEELILSFEDIPERDWELY